MVARDAARERSERRRTVGGSCNSARVVPVRRRFGCRRGRFRRAAEGLPFGEPGRPVKPAGPRGAYFPSWIVGENRVYIITGGPVWIQNPNGALPKVDFFFLDKAEALPDPSGAPRRAA
eukprot:7192673-Prymnesium_polylepis.1